MLSDADLQKLDQSSHAFCNEAAREIRELRSLLISIWNDYGKHGDISVNSLEHLERIMETIRQEAISPGVLREARANVALDGSTRRGCDNPGCVKEYQHEGQCQTESE